MQVNSVNSVAFGRKPNQREMQVYTSSVKQGLSLLGKEVDVIIHNASAPSVASENVGIGSLFSRTTFEKLLPFLKNHSISHIQQEPNGLRKAGDFSPYAPEAMSKNIFMIPLEKLASDEYGNILSKKTFDKIVRGKPHSAEVDYDYVKKSYDIALREAFSNSKDSKELLAFKKKNENVYEESAIFRILSNEYGEKPYKAWNKVDRDLYLDRKSKQSQDRIAEIKSKYQDDYNFYFFQQMILEKENKKSNDMARKTGISIIGDSPVASTSVENWVNQNLFLKGKAIGCPPDFFSKSGQRWGFAYYDPEKIFNKDGSLGEAGKLLKEKYDTYFASFPGGLRIDHTIGLVDPFIYTVNSKKMTPSNSGRIYSLFESKYQKKNDDEFASMFNKIIIPSAKEHGMDKSSLICEDLGDPNPATQRVMKKLGLSGISVTQFDVRGSKAPAKNTIMLGSHDNKSFLEYIEDLFDFAGNDGKRKHFLRKTRFLADDTAPKGSTKEEVKTYRKELRNDKKSFLAASFVELFASPAKRVQIFFADFWGIPKTYNVPGTSTGNWSLRLGENFEDDYYREVANGKAPNFADAIARALRQRGLDKGQENLMKDLDSSAKILNEKV